MDVEKRWRTSLYSQRTRYYKPGGIYALHHCRMLVLSGGNEVCPPCSARRRRLPSSFALRADPIRALDLGVGVKQPGGREEQCGLRPVPFCPAIEYGDQHPIAASKADTKRSVGRIWQ